MVYVYLADVSNLPDPLMCPEYLDKLAEERKQKILKYKQLKDRKQSLGSGLLLSKVLEQYGRDMSEIYYEENGKPAMDGLYFNISHSENVAVCAVSDEPVGIDIEKIRDIKKNIVDRYFTCHEKKYLNNIEDSFRNAAFIRMWTIKESYVKYTGEGMKLALDNFDIRISQDIQIYRDAELCKCHIKEYNLSDYKLTVCASENEFSDEVNIVVL